ncbi:unnamed protein product [Arabidopsis halleri]
MYKSCEFQGSPDIICESITGCKSFSGNACPPSFPNDILKNLGDVVNEYCKVGCASSSLCGALTTLQNSDGSETVNGVVEQCAKACSTICTKGSKTAVKTA